MNFIASFSPKTGHIYFAYSETEDTRRVLEHIRIQAGFKLFANLYILKNKSLSNLRSTELC